MKFLYFRIEDVQWFASSQPHLQTPATVIELEAKDMRNPEHFKEIESTPNVKKRSCHKTNSQKPHKIVFSSSEDDITEMLRAHNKKIQNQLPSSSKSGSNNEVMDNKRKSTQVSTKSAINPRRSVLASACMSTKCLNEINQTGLEGASDLNAVKTFPNKTCAIQMDKNGNNRKSNILLNDVLSKSNCSHNGLVKSEYKDLNDKDLSHKRRTQLLAVKKGGSKINADYCPAAGANYKKTLAYPAASTSPCKPIQVNSASVSSQKRQVSSSIPTNVKPQIKMKRSYMPDGKRVPSRIKNINGASACTKDTVAKKSVARDFESSSAVACTKIKNKHPASTQSKVKGVTNSRRTLGQIQNKSSSNFSANSNVLSIINAKSPSKCRSNEIKHRYSVETPSPHRSAQVSDDEDLDSFLTAQLKAHNAKVNAKSSLNSKIPGKTVKTGKYVSLHLGSPSRPKARPMKK